MGKTRGLFKKIGDPKGTFHAKNGTTKGRNCMDLIEAEDIKKRWKEYTEDLFLKKIMKNKKQSTDNNDSVITHLEEDILEGEVK